MLKIRLQRFGRKHDPTFRVVLTDSRNSTKSGRFLEVLGSYDPRGKRGVTFNKERIAHWMSKGVKPTGAIHNLLIKVGAIKGKKIHVSPNVKPVVKEAEAKVSSEEGTKENSPLAEEKKEA